MGDVNLRRVGSGHSEMCHRQFIGLLGVQFMVGRTSVELPCTSAIYTVFNGRPNLNCIRGSAWTLVIWLCLSSLGAQSLHAQRSSHPVHAFGSTHAKTFVCVSGLTTAYVGSEGGVTRAPGTMPDDVTRELSILLEPQNHYTAILTVGPKFDSRVESAWIAGDWSVGIRVMVDRGTLSRDSDYINELLRSLELIAQSASSVEFTVARKPAAGIESLLDKILNMVL